MPTYRYRFSWGIDEGLLPKQVNGKPEVVAMSSCHFFVDVGVDDADNKGDLDVFMRDSGFMFDREVEDSAKDPPPNLTLPSPDGSRWEVLVGDDGSLSTRRVPAK
jgi:hypothetical protein